MPKNEMRTTLQTKMDPGKPKNSVFHSNWCQPFSLKGLPKLCSRTWREKRIFADFILNSPFSMEFDFEIDWKNQSLEYNGDQSLLHLNYWILGHSPHLCKHFGNLWSTIFLLCFHFKKALFKNNKIIRQVNVMSSWVKSLDMEKVFAAGITG